MQLTTHELSIIPSIVAVVAIVGGYLGVRSANRTSVSIARDERAARRESELDTLKRAAYSAFLVALSKLADDQIELDVATKHERSEREEIWLRATQSARVANDNLATLALVAPQSICAFANAAFGHALKATEADIAAVAEEGEALAGAMRRDLESGANQTTSQSQVCDLYAADCTIFLDAIAVAD
jgi:hypothetical protein